MIIAIIIGWVICGILAAKVQSHLIDEVLSEKYVLLFILMGPLYFIYLFGYVGLMYISEFVNHKHIKKKQEEQAKADEELEKMMKTIKGNEDDNQND